MSTISNVNYGVTNPVVITSNANPDSVTKTLLEAFMFTSTNPYANPNTELSNVYQNMTSTIASTPDKKVVLVQTGNVSNYFTVSTSDAQKTLYMNYFDQFLKTKSPPVKSLEDIMSFYNQTIILNDANSNVLYGVKPSAISESYGFFEGIQSDFKTIMSVYPFMYDGFFDTEGDWTAINNSYSLFGGQGADNNNIVYRTFNAFMQTYDSAGKGLDDLIKAFHDFLMPTAVTLTNKYLDGNIYSPNGFIKPFANGTSYESVYTQYAQDNSPGAFKNFLTSFVNNIVSTQGYFIPGKSINDFLNAVQNNDPTNIKFNELPGSSISETNSGALLILNRILQLLIKLVGSLQDVGIVQSQRLTFYTKFQNAYTTMQSQIPVFTRGAAGNSNLASSLGADSTEAADARNQINSQINGALTDGLRAYRDIWTNNAKQLQGYINTTNDAVNQQTDMITTFIQQMSSLLSTIMR